MVREHVAKIVQDRGIVRTGGQDFAEEFLRLIILFLALKSGRPQEGNIFLVFGLN